MAWRGSDWFLYYIIVGMINFAIYCAWGTIFCLFVAVFAVTFAFIPRRDL